MNTSAGCIFCPQDDTEALVAAGIPLELPPKGSSGLCGGCGNIMISTGEVWRPAESTDRIEGLALLVRGRELARLQRALDGFKAPTTCPLCASSFGQRDFLNSGGLLPFDRLLCPRCFAVFVAEPCGAVHPARAGEIGEQERRGLDYVRGLLARQQTKAGEDVH